MKKENKKTNNKSKKQSNRAGFTLIELLAVIVIMGILMMAAIPAITSAIERSRKSTYASNAKELVSSVRTSINNGDATIETAGSATAGAAVGSTCQLPAKGSQVIIRLTGATIKNLLERGGTESSFGQKYTNEDTDEAGRVYIINRGTDSDLYVYYIFLKDTGNNLIAAASGTAYVPVAEDNVTRNNVQVSAKSTTIPTTLASSVASKPDPSGGAYSNQSTCIISS